MGMSISSIGALEAPNGSPRVPDLKTLKSIAQLYGQSLDWLVDGVGEMQPIPTAEQVAS